MPEISTGVRVYEIDYTCDECGIGQMRPVKQNTLMLSSHIVHACNHCGAEKDFQDVAYPKIAYEKDKPDPFARRVEQDKACPKCREVALTQVGLDGHFAVYECQRCGYQGSLYAPVYQRDSRQTHTKDRREVNPL